MRLTHKDQKMTIAVIGAGNRAGEYLKAMEKYYQEMYEVVAVFEPKQVVREYYQKKYNLKEEQLFEGLKDFMKLDRLADVAIIATPDGLHYEVAIQAIEKGYDVILEKPIAMTLEQTIEIGEVGRRHPDQLVAVCHVLRHSPFMVKLKEIIDSKELGEIVDIQHNENIGYYHFAHSYVRGNWRNTDVAAPIIVAKSCHDMDIMLSFLNDKHCVRISSMGALSFFNHEHYKEGMAPRCSDCSVEKDCPFSALKIYSSGKIRSVVFDQTTSAKFLKELEVSPYGRCVFNSDNNVPDHQVTILEFEGGVHATFNMSAFSNKIHRSLKIMCQYGEIRATEIEQIIEVWKFGEEPKIVKVEQLGGGHGGADEGFIKGFMETYLKGKKFNSPLEMSIESHVMAFAAEASRQAKGESINISKFHKEHMK